MGNQSSECGKREILTNPTKFTVKPVESCFTTSARGGTKSSCVTALCSLAPSLPIPKLQNVVKYAHRMPNKMKYNPASVAFVMFLNNTEKITMTADTVDKMSCPQKPHRPKVLHALAVRCTFLAMLAVLSSESLAWAKATPTDLRCLDRGETRDTVNASDPERWKPDEPKTDLRCVSAGIAAAGASCARPWARAPTDARTARAGRRDARTRVAMGKARRTVRRGLPRD